MAYATRFGDQHTCPMLNPDGSPHVGGSIAAGHPTTLVCYMSAARMGDPATCTGPIDTITGGASHVLIGYMPAARLGDKTQHGGVITEGCSTVEIGDAGGGGGGAAAGIAASRAKKKRAAMRKKKSRMTSGKAVAQAPSVCATPPAPATSPSSGTSR
jgi:uncharacterized Zn-binding protein involved in type VI secretion